MKGCALVVFGCLVLIIGTVIIKGIGSMNLDMITKTPEGGYYLGKEGGVLNAIVGSFVLTLSATAIALLMSLPVVLYINVYAKKNSRLATLIRLSLDFLWGIPSIVYGAFGFTVMIFFGITASLLGGIITVSLFILPIMARAMDEVISLVPGELFEASYSLGATKFETALKVITRQTMPGIVSAALIAFGRVGSLYRRFFGSNSPVAPPAGCDPSPCHFLPAGYPVPRGAGAGICERLDPDYPHSHRQRNRPLSYGSVQAPYHTIGD